MTLKELCAIAFQQGADVSLEEVLASDSYDRRLSRLYRSQFLPTASQQRATAAGVHEFGAALQRSGFNGRQALRQVGRSGADLKTPEDQALVWELGDRLMDRAFGELPALAKVAAHGWRKLDAGEQMEVLARLLPIFQPDKGSVYEHQVKLEERALGERAAFAAMFEQRSPSTFLPARFHERGKREGPSCLGLSIMLAAFARISGARFMFYTLADGIDGRAGRLLGEVGRGLAKQARLHGIRDPDMYRSLEGVYRQARTKARVIQGWHHAIVIQFENGTWVSFDPYFGCVNILEDASRADEIYRLLTKYGLVLPGLCLQLDDGGRFDKFEAERLGAADSLLGLAQEFHEGVMQDRWPTAERLLGSPELRPLSKLLSFKDPSSTEETKPFKPEVLAEWWTSARLPDVQVDPAAEIQVYNGSVEARVERLLLLERHFYAYFYMQFEGGVKRAQRRQLLTHPAIDVQLPATGIGLMVLSNLLSHTPELTGKFELATLLAGASNSQMLWCEAQGYLPEQAELTDEQRQVMNASKRAVRALPKLYGRSRIRLGRKPPKHRRLSV